MVVLHWLQELRRALAGPARWNWLVKALGCAGGEKSGEAGAVAAEIAAAGGTAQPFELDVASEESIKAGAKAVIERSARSRYW